MAERNSELEPVVTAEDLRQEAITKWGYVAARLKADAAVIQAIAVHIELGIVREDPSQWASRIHEAVASAKGLLT